MRPIDADKLENVFEEHEDRRGDLDCDWRILIDNAPTIEPETKVVANVTFDKEQMEELVEKAKADILEQIERPQGEQIAWEQGYEFGKNEKRPQGECKSCRYRDPEDKKCDCGGQERQGCQFPVSDDYYCKYYEKGGAE